MTHDQLLALTGDQIKYFEFSLKWPDLLKQNIPFGFPLFLRIVPIQALPWVTLALWVSSLGFLTWSLAQAGFRRSMILGIVGPLSVSIAMRPWLWHGNPYFYGNTERLTAILATILLALIVDYHGDWRISAVTFAMALVRPAMLFVPAVVWLMKPTLKRAYVLIVPFAFFIGLRWVVAGEPTFCSYGAWQATRIYAMMVEPDDLSKTPENLHPLMRDILNYIPNPLVQPQIIDRASEEELYTRWRYGDEYQWIVRPYSNVLLRELWGYEFRLHWKERVSIYFRALRVALTKIQDPLLVFGLMGFLWLLLVARRIDLWYRRIFFLDTRDAVLMLRWFGLWTAFSIGTLLLVQFPDDRYMQICFLWLPSMIGCAIGLIW